MMTALLISTVPTVRKNLADYLPWIAIVLAVIVVAVYLDTRSKVEQAETYESCLSRLTTSDESDADKALNRSICAGKPKSAATAPH